MFRKRALFIILAISCFIGSTKVVLSKESIQQITSKKKSEQVDDKIPAPRPKPKNRLRTHSIGFGVGQTFLLGDFRETADDSITVDLFYGYSASHSFDMLLNLHYSTHEFNKMEVTLPGLVVGVKGKLYHFDSFAPFCLAGLGFYSPTSKRSINSAGTIKESDSKLTFGIHFGAGADLRLNNNYSIGILGHYHDPFDIKQETGPKVRGSYFKLLITAYYIY